MRIAVSNIAWDIQDDEEIASLLLQNGVDAIEVAPTKYWPAPCNPSASDIQKCRMAWADRRISIVAMQSLLFGMPMMNLFGSTEIRQNMLDYLAEIIEISSSLGSTRLVFGSPRNRDRTGLSDAQAHDVAVGFFGSIAECARKASVVIGLEPNPVLYNCNFATTAIEALSVVKAVNHPCLGLHLDTGIMTLNSEDIEATLDDCAPYICHFHISEPHLAPVGSGPVHHQRIGSQLKKINYIGVVSIEMRSSQVIEVDRLNVRNALSCVKQNYM
jgi:D-psicose/D-tagatose/L-ribulose 3-epimerase